MNWITSLAAAGTLLCAFACPGFAQALQTPTPAECAQLRALTPAERSALTSLVSRAQVEHVRATCEPRTKSRTASRGKAKRVRR